MNNHQQRATRLNLSAAIASVTVALVLVALKAWALADTGSLAVAATLADSVLDLMVSATGLAAIAYAARPPDEDHTFGHGSAEDLTALGQALFLTGAAIVLAVVSVHRLLAPEPATLEAEGRGMLVMAIAIVLSIALVGWQQYVARQTGNRVVAADMMHYLSDLMPSIGAILALWLSARFGISGFDSVIALLAAAVLVHGAVKIGSGAWNALMDRGAEPDILAKVVQIAQDTPGVSRLHDMRSRTSGSRVFIDFHIEIDGDLSLRVAHEIAAGLKRRILEELPQIDLLIHMDPTPASDALTL